jgi:hypothetical protein
MELALWESVRDGSASELATYLEARARLVSPDMN